MKQFYETNKDFKAYVDKYCTKHHLTVDEALEHKMVQSYAEACGYEN